MIKGKYKSNIDCSTSCLLQEDVSSTTTSEEEIKPEEKTPAKPKAKAGKLSTLS
jgi:hypothetical protein